VVGLQLHFGISMPVEKGGVHTIRFDLAASDRSPLPLSEAQIRAKTDIRWRERSLLEA